jgi:hypothetical protein
MISRIVLNAKGPIEENPLLAIVSQDFLRLQMKIATVKKKNKLS